MFPSRRTVVISYFWRKPYYVSTFSFCQFDPYVIWLGKHLPIPFGHIIALPSSVFLLPRPSFTCRSKNLIPCNGVHSAMVIVYAMVIVNIHVFTSKKVPACLIYISTYIIKNFEPVYEKLRDTCQIHFN